MDKSTEFQTPTQVHTTVSRSWLTLCNPMNCSPPGNSVHGTSQARNLDWVAISFSRGYFGSRNQTQVSYVSSLAVAGGFFTTEPPEKLKFTNPETLQPSPSGFFWQLYNRSTVNEIIGHWPLNSISNPSPCLEFRDRWGWKFQPSIHKAGSPGNQPPSLGDFPKSPH